MSIAADAAQLHDAPKAFYWRWGAALGIILAAHAGAVSAFLYLDRHQSQDGPPPAPIMLTLAPLPTAPGSERTDLAPGPRQVESDPAPEMKTPKEMVDAKHADLPEPLRRPTHEPKHDRPAPTTSAPQAAPDTAAVAAAPVAGVSADQADALMDWQARLRAHLEHYKRYPRAARLRGETGEATLRFVVDRTGTVLSSAIATSSGFAALDEETLEMIRRAEPLPPMPAELGAAQQVFTIPVQFGLN